MFESVLIANRGEIACRIIRTARRMGLRAIAVYSRADAGALHVRMADEAHEIGPAPAALSYLNGARILEVARRTGVHCLHPGYGFLSENAEFAEACAAAGVVFVGPPPAAIRAMGLKDEAKAIMRGAGVPVTPGYDGVQQEADFLAAQAQEIGYPVLIKAVAGGGGKGMRRVDHAADFADALAGAQREALAAFGNARVLIEKYISGPRHIEMQVFADTHGNAVHLFERDCSLQRRHQKVIEEAPAPGMTEEMRAAMGAAAVAAAKAVGYTGAGTVEFIVDGSEGLRPDRFWFMEMNTRLQVEHPVTEAITGLDLVELQLRVAAGERLPFVQDDLGITGHAVEARLYAEDAGNDFLPSTGRLLALELPAGEGVRVDAGVEAGDVVTPHYDPMIAKIIAHAPTRDGALSKLASALGDVFVAGPRSNAAFLRRLAVSTDFAAGRFDTGYIDAHRAEAVSPELVDTEAAAAVGLAALLAARKGEFCNPSGLSPWDKADAFQFGGARRLMEKVSVGGEVFELPVEWKDEAAVVPGRTSRDGWRTLVDGDTAFVSCDGVQREVRLHDPADGRETGSGAGEGTIRSPMHGKVVAVLVEGGARVRKGQRLAIVEAMKMEHVLVAPHDGVAQEISATPGQQIAQGARMMVVAQE